MNEVLVNRLGGLSLPRKSVVRLTYRPDMTLDVYRGRKTIQQQQQHFYLRHLNDHLSGKEVLVVPSRLDIFSCIAFLYVLGCIWNLIVSVTHHHLQYQLLIIAHLLFFS